ncbi:GPP34 family phosphoprotein [Salinibacterium sp. SWN1162]|uniref:GPP34 family phosphoprotein n=1 Tax=Salinibacterium sp. SWN1162 TaxID=2792053 RepID=UPI0018CC917C|nr:GPP34 family phosphoprotein [Salinibacterium sp. SWN1162]MBH0008849.1 GPP34 family phosphoprotein [Salinibacterium sp. SWN1162]
MAPQPDLLLAEAVSLVSGFDANTGVRLEAGGSRSGNPILTVSAAVLIDLADNGYIELERDYWSKNYPGVYLSRVKAGQGEPGDTVLRAALDTVQKRSKPRKTEDVIVDIVSPEVQKRLIDRGLATSTGRFIKTVRLTQQGFQAQAELRTEIDAYLDESTLADASLVSGRTALILALTLSGRLAEIFYQRQHHEASIEVERRLTLLRNRVNAEGDNASHRSAILGALSSANSGFVH